jgi:hypothetical protein
VEGDPDGARKFDSLSFPEAASDLPEKPVYEKPGRQRGKVEPTVGRNEFRRAN